MHDINYLFSIKIIKQSRWDRLLKVLLIKTLFFKIQGRAVAPLAPPPSAPVYLEKIY
jgi:hypothetical protein